MNLAYPYTPEQHAAIEAKRGRPVTDDGMREARHADDDATDSGLSIVDRVIADSRRGEPLDAACVDAERTYQREVARRRRKGTT